MARHQGGLLHLPSKTLRERDGRIYRVEALQQTGDALYYRLHFPDDPQFAAVERWLLPQHHWVINRFRMHAGAAPFRCDWYIDLDAITVTADRWRVADCYLDVDLYEGQRYEVRDADELAEGLASGEITLREAAAALQALQALCVAVAQVRFSGAALLAQTAPGLPVPDP